MGPLAESGGETERDREYTYNYTAYIYIYIIFFIIIFVRCQRPGTISLGRACVVIAIACFLVRELPRRSPRTTILYLASAGAGSGKGLRSVLHAAGIPGILRDCGEHAPYRDTLMHPFRAVLRTRVWFVGAGLVRSIATSMTEDDVDFSISGLSHTN